MCLKPSLFAVSACALALAALMPATGFAHDDDHRRHGGGNVRYGDYDSRQGGFQERGREHDHGRHYRPRVIYQPQPQVYYYNSFQFPQAYPHYYQPGHYPQRAFVGQRLVRYEPVPSYARHRLHPAPRGYYYAASGRDVLLVSQRDNIVVQILELLLN